MKTTKLIALAMVGLALSFTPAMAQRGGGGGSRSGGGHSSASVSRSSSPSSSSRSSFSGSSSRSSFSGSSRSSSSRSSFSSPSRSSSSSRSSFSSPSRSSSSSRSSFSSPSRSTSTPSRSSATRSNIRSSRGSYGTPSRSSSATPSRSGATPAGRGSFDRTSSSRSGVGTNSRTSSGRPSSARGGVGRGDASATRSGAHVGSARPGGAPAGNVRPSGNPSARSAGYARPGHPGPLPPSSRPIRPAPYFYHPWHGYVVHCHPIFWEPLIPRPWYWPGFWLYCNSYWYDYHVTDVVVVRQYVQDTYNVDMITYGISGDIMYAIVRDGGDTYLQVYDKEDHLIAEQKIHRKYCNLVIDAESGGCWISKKHDKDPLLFLWSDGQLLIYEAD